MTDAEILEKVKAALGITSDYQDATLLIYIDDVKAFAISAGVSEELMADEKAIGLYVRGVADLWDYGSGNLSDYFKMRLYQLRAESREDDDE